MALHPSPHGIEARVTLPLFIHCRSRTMQRTSIRFALVAFAFPLLPGCASLLNKGKQSLVINSSPAGATVLVNGAEQGVTPFTYAFSDPKGSDVQVELRKTGHLPVAYVLHPRRSNGVLLADAMLLGIPYAADAKSSSMFSFPVHELSANLYKEYPADRQKLEVPVSEPDNVIPQRAVVGHLGGRKLAVEDKELGELRYGSAAMASMLQGFANTWADAFQARAGTAKGDEGIRRAKLLLKPVVKGIDMQLAEVQRRAYGSVAVDMEWRFFSGMAKDSLLFAVQKHTVCPINGVNPREALGEALKDAARQLLDEEGLYERLAALHAAGLERSKGDRLQLPKPTPVAFADRRAMIPALVKGVVTVEMKNGHGSGFLITNDGYVLTNAHVVGDAGTAKVRFEQGFALDGQVVKVNRDFDVALIKVAGSDLPALALGDDNAVLLGEEIYAIGTPLDEKLGQSVSRGIMSGRREIDGRKYLQTDVSINPGNSGGPLINDQGTVVGIATMKVKAAGVEGIGFGVPITTALNMLNIEFSK